MAYEMVMPYHLHMPSYFLETFTEYPQVELGINIFQDSPLGRCFRLQIYDFFSILQTVYRKKLNYRQYIIIYPAFRPY